MICSLCVEPLADAGFLQVLLTLMTRLEAPLGLPAGTFAKLHDPEQLSGSECRIIRKPAEGETDHVDEGDKGGVKAASIGAHTDFGSCMSLLASPLFPSPFLFFLS